MFSLRRMRTAAIFALGFLSLSCGKSRSLTRDPVPYVTTGSDAGPIVLRSALETFGIPVADYNALRRECSADETGASVDDLERVANTRGLRATQVMDTVVDAVNGAGNLPSIAIVGTASALDYWLLWRREEDRILVMNPRIGNVWMQANEVQRSLYVHEMRLAASRETVDSPLLVRREGDLVIVRGAVVLKLRR